MDQRRYIIALFASVIIFPCLLIIHAAILYSHPELATNDINIAASILAYTLFGIGMIITLIFLRNNTHRLRRKEHRVRLRETRYRKLIEDSGFSTITIDRQGIIRFVSKNIERISGYNADELTGGNLLKCMPAIFRPQIADIIANMEITEEYPETIQVQVFTIERVDKWVSCRIYPVKNSNNEITELTLMIWDTEKERLLQLELQSMEQSQKSQQKLMQTILDHSPALVYIKDLQGNFVFVNQKFKTITGVERNEDIINSDVYTEEKIKEVHRQDEMVMSEKRPIPFEEDFLLKNGNRAYFWAIKFPIFNGQGEVEYICGIDTDITALKLSEQIIIGAKKEAEQAKAAQETFLANISHEIRTPMNGIIGMSNLMRDTSLNAEQKEYLDAIGESAKNLLSIINDLLDFSKIKSGKFHLETIDFKPRNIIQTTMYPLLVRANEKKLALNCFIDTTIPDTLNGDPIRLQQIIINLVGNAIKFTDSGSIEIKVYPQSYTEDSLLMCIDVIDTGIGIAQDKIDNIFESYVQSDTSISRLHGGTGLGLAIVKQLAELQNGSVNATSTLGKGSIFNVQIPYKIVQSSNTNPAQINEVVNNNNEMLKGIRILVAEDNLINQKVVRQTLLRQKAEVEIAGNGKSALEKLNYQDFDILLMDLQMPEMDGYTATYHIRNIMKNPVPIVAMTADAIKGESDKCFEVGMNDYISKPFDPKELYNKILSLTRNKTFPITND
ncbi:MAG TPA: PAS domain S-box protein [Flavipsychrobacter sp.]|nr:PAS domain S-box protein [Flavipsychrobacter sp.]